MLARTERWSAINSGTAQPRGPGQQRPKCSPTPSRRFPGEIALVEPAPVESVTADGRRRVDRTTAGTSISRVRPEAPVRLLFTGHMDTVFPADHPFQPGRWLDDDALNAPGAADMKGGLALMLAALEAVEASPRRRGSATTCMINSDEETGSLLLRAPDRRAPRATRSRR